jgi:hypothetical protein
VTDSEVTDELAGLGGHDPYEEDDDEYDDWRPWWQRPAAIIATVAVLIGLGLGLGFGLRGGHSTPSGPEGVPLQNVPDLASPNSTVTGHEVDGITCRPTMNQGVNYHVHVHVDIFVNGVQERIPAGAGIDQPRLTEQQPGGEFVDNGSRSCLYWLHVHANDGIIHVEALHQQNFILGQFFDIWGQPLSSTQVGPAQGQVTALVNGKVWTGDPRNIPLASQSVIQLDVGTPVVAFRPMAFTVTGSCSTSCSAGPTG